MLFSDSHFRIRMPGLEGFNARIRLGVLCKYLAVDIEDRLCVHVLFGLQRDSAKAVHVPVTRPGVTIFKTVVWCDTKV